MVRSLADPTFQLRPEPQQARQRAEPRHQRAEPPQTVPAEVQRTERREAPRRRRGEAVVGGGEVREAGRERRQRRELVRGDLVEGMVGCRMSNVECRMSKMVRKRLEPCQKSLQRLSDVALCARKEKEKGK